jgi:DNA-binding MarR family transcriptional regulator
MQETIDRTTNVALQNQLIAFIRAFGLHRPDQTPCGQPVAVAEAHALMELAREAPLSQNDLVARLCLEKSTVSRLVGLLEQRGWIERQRNALDGRMLDLRLTDAGQRIAADLAAARQAKFARILDAIPEEKRAFVLDALQTLVEAMREDQ